jgi:hypothetical protein
MVTIKIDEYLIINSYNRSKRWLSKPPGRPKANEIVIHIKGIVKYPEPAFVADFGELTVSEAEVFAQAKME